MENPRPGVQTLGQTRCAEDDQRQPQYRNGIEVAEQGRQFFQQTAQAHTFQAEQQAVQQAKGHILPRSAVPQAGQDKNDHQVAAGAGQAAAAAAQGNVEVIPEPAGKRDMPAAPVFAHALGKVGVIEVFRQVQPEKAADADGHIAVAGKVKIQLHHVSQIPQHQVGGRHGGGGHRCHPLVDERQLVGNQGLFGEAENKALDAIAEAVDGNPAGFPAGVQHGALLAVPHNRAGRPMPEEGEEHKEPQRAAGRFYPPGGYVHTVADGGEHIKADAQGQRRGEHRQQIGDQSVDGLGGKACVFKKAQHTQVGKNQQRQQHLFGGKALQQQPAQPVQGRQPDQNRRAPQPGPGKEHQAEQAQHGVARKPGQQVVDSQRQRQKDKQKLYRGKSHTVVLHLS